MKNGGELQDGAFLDQRILTSTILKKKAGMMRALIGYNFCVKYMLK